MITKVLNMFGNRSESVFENKGLYDANLIRKKQLPFALINSDDSSNKKPYIIDDNSIILDDLIDKGNGALNYKNYYDLNLLLSIISYDTKSMNDNFIYTIKPGFSENRKEGRALLSKYFDSLRAKEHSSENINKYIIPVPDRLEIQAQDRLLKASKSLSANTLLLWRSVAACIGAEEEIKKRNLQANDKVLVVDFHGNGMTETILTMHDYKGRLIPGHKIFYNCKDRKPKIENYPVDDVLLKPLKNGKFLHFEMDNGFLKSNYIISTRTESPKYINDNGYKLIIVIGKGLISSNGIDISKVVIDKDEKLIEKGAALFAYRQEQQIVSYYDECDTLSLVVTTASEEITFKTLIQGSDKIEGGIRIQSPDVEGVFLPKGQSKIKFYLLMGEQNRNDQLKVLEQELVLTEELIDNPKEIPLVLKPFMIAGQGQAFVDISAKKDEDLEIFPTVSLDWEQMDDAFDNGTPVTVAYLEKNLERTFPVDMPPVKAFEHLSSTNASKLKSFIEEMKKNSDDLKMIYLNHSSWPKKDALDLSRFERYNLFGNPRANDYEESILTTSKDNSKQILDYKNSYYDSLRDKSLPGDGRLARLFLEVLQKRVENAYPYIDKYIGLISWTYHPDYFPKVINKTLEEVCWLGYNKVSATTQKLTLCANLLEKDEDLLKFIRAFISRLEQPEGINNWVRAGYQILMYNTAFLKELELQECYLLVENLCTAYVQKWTSNVICTNIISCLLYSLKIRRYHSSFSKSTSNEIKDLEMYERIYWISLVPFIKDLRCRQNNYLGVLKNKTNEEELRKFLELCEKIRDKRCENAIDLEFSIKELNCLAYFEPLINENRISNYQRLCRILRDYLNGKGNLDIPIDDSTEE